MLTKILVFILILLKLSISLAADSTEAQEARLARAEIALAEGNDKQALSLIASNLDPVTFHRASFQFILDYHLKKGKYSKALKVLHYMASKLHDKRVLSARFDQNFLNFLSTLSVPRKDALEIYFSIGELYFDLYQKQVFNSDFDNRLLSMAQKYFEVTQYFRYQIGLSKIYIGKILSEKENYRGALKQFLTAKEVFQDEMETKSDQGLEDINLLIGTTMVQGGLFDPGTLYLRSIFLETGANTATKAIAQEYLDAVNYEYFSLAAKYDYLMNDNVYELNEFQLSRFSNFESLLGPKDGSATQIGLSAFYNQPTLFEHTNVLFLTSFNQTNYSEELHQNRNERNLSFGFDGKYTNIERALPKLRYLYTKSYNPSGNTDGFEATSTTHSVELSYIKTIKSGSINYSLPYAATSYETGTEEKSIGLNVSYTPFWTLKLFSPSISLGYFNRNEVSVDEAGTRYDLSTSFQSEWTDNFSTFTNLLVRKNTNELAFFDYTEYDFTLSGTYVWSWGFSFNAEVNLRNRTNTDDSKLSVMTSSVSATFTY